MPGQLTLWEREQIAQFRNRGWSRAKIARQLKRHPTTIGRELTRNSDGDRYWASVAEEKAAARRQRRPRKLDDPRLSEYVRAGLAKRWPLAVVFAVRPATGAAGKTREIAGPGPDRGPAGHRGPATTVRRLGGRYGRRQGTSQRVGNACRSQERLRPGRQGAASEGPLRRPRSPAPGSTAPGWTAPYSDVRQRQGVRGS